MSGHVLPWVASSERMPEDRYEWCIVIYQDTVQHMPATYEDGWWYWADDETDPLDSDHVSHWLSIRAIAELRGTK